MYSRFNLPEERKTESNIESNDNFVCLFYFQIVVVVVFENAI